VILGLPYRPQTWATNMFCALQGAQDDTWLRSPEWKQFTNVRKEMEQRQMSVSVIQAITLSTICFPRHGRNCDRNLRNPSYQQEEMTWTLPPGTSPSEAKAKQGEWLAEIETRIAALRAAKNGHGQPLTRRNAHALAGEWYRWFIARNEPDLRTPSYWKKQSDTLLWDVLYPHAPDEFLRDTKADPSGNGGPSQSCAKQSGPWSLRRQR
jgi:hypothetical protein